MKFFYVYAENLGILGTSRLNVAEDLRMAVQTPKSRGLDTHEENVHSDTVIALGIHTLICATCWSEWLQCVCGV